MVGREVADLVGRLDRGERWSGERVQEGEETHGEGRKLVEVEDRVGGRRKEGRRVELDAFWDGSTLVREDREEEVS